MRYAYVHAGGHSGHIRNAYATRDKLKRLLEVQSAMNAPAARRMEALKAEIAALEFYARVLCRAVDAATNFIGDVAGGASWWDDVWADHFAALDRARMAVSAARGIDSGEAGETPKAARPEGQEPGPEGAHMQPREERQPISTEQMLPEIRRLRDAGLCVNFAQGVRFAERVHLGIDATDATEGTR